MKIFVIKFLLVLYCLWLSIASVHTRAAKFIRNDSLEMYHLYGHHDKNIVLANTYKQKINERIRILVPLLFQKTSHLFQSTYNILPQKLQTFTRLCFIHIENPHPDYQNKISLDNLSYYCLEIFFLIISFCLLMKLTMQTFAQQGLKLSLVLLPLVALSLNISGFHVIFRPSDIGAFASWTICYYIYARYIGLHNFQENNKYFPLLLLVMSASILIRETAIVLSLWFAIDMYFSSNRKKIFSATLSIIVPTVTLFFLIIRIYTPDVPNDFAHGNFFENMAIFTKANFTNASLVGFILRPFHLLGGILLCIFLFGITRERNKTLKLRHKILFKSFIFPIVLFWLPGVLFSSYAWEGQGQLVVLLVPSFSLLILLLSDLEFFTSNNPSIQTT